MDLEPQPQPSTFSPTLQQRGETLPTQNHGSHPSPPASGSFSLALVRGGRASFPAGGPSEDTPRPIGSGTEQQRCSPHPTLPRTELTEPTKPTEPTEPTEPIEPVEPIEPIEPIEPTEPIEPIEPIVPIVPIEPIEPIEPTEPIELTELTVNGHHRSQHLPPDTQNFPGTPGTQDPPLGIPPYYNEQGLWPGGTPEPQDLPTPQGDQPPNRNEQNANPDGTDPESTPTPNGHQANIRLATLNMRGHSSPLTGTGSISKWTAVTKVLHSRQIGILALQETHLSTKLKAQAAQILSRHFALYNSPDPENPTGSAGVAFVINKEKLDTNSISLMTLIPGRAIFLSIP